MIIFLLIQPEYWVLPYYRRWMHNLSPPFKCCISQLVSCLLMDLVRLSGEKKLEIKKLTGGKSSPRNSVIAHHVQKYFFYPSVHRCACLSYSLLHFPNSQWGKKIVRSDAAEGIVKHREGKGLHKKRKYIKVPRWSFRACFFVEPPLPTFSNSTDFILLSDTTTSLFLNLAVLVNYFCFHCFATSEQYAVCLVLLDIVSRLGHISERVYVSKATIFIIFFFSFVWYSLSKYWEPKRP